MKKFIENNSFSLVVGMFEKYGSTEEVAINFCNKLYDCKSSDADADAYVYKIIRDYIERVDINALCSAIAYLSIFEENCKLYELSDEPYLKWWLGVFYWNKRNRGSFGCIVDSSFPNPNTVTKCIGFLLDLGELVLEQDKESKCLNICLNHNDEQVDTRRAFEIYNSCMYKADFLYYAYDNTITMEEASRVIGFELVEGNLDLIGVC